MNPSPPPEFASTERIAVVERDLTDIKGKQDQFEAKLHTIDVKTAEQSILLGTIITELKDQRSQQSKWGWTMITALITLATGLFWYLMNNLPQGGGV